MIAAAILLIVAGLLLNSYFTAETPEGSKTYKIFPADTGLDFEESDLYRDLFRNAVSDILRLVVIREQLETDGELNFSKIIDVTAYAEQIGVDQGCTATVKYELDDIIKWGKSDVDYTTRVGLENRIAVRYPLMEIRHRKKNRILLRTICRRPAAAKVSMS